MTQPNDVSQFLESAAPVLADGHTYEVARVTEMEAECGAYSITAECPACQHQRPILGPQRSTIPYEGNQPFSGELTTLGSFYSGKSNDSF